MAFCPNCGAALPDGRPFCTHCGTPLTAAASPAASAPSAYAQSPQRPPQFPQMPEPPRRTSQRIGQPPQYGEQAAQYGGQYGTAQQENPPIDWTRLQPRKSPGGASALIAGLTLLLLAAVMLIWGMSV